MKEKLGNLDKIAEKIKKFLDEEDAVREQALKSCREIIRLSATAIKKTHQGKLEESEKMINEGREILKLTKEKLGKFPEIYFAGFLHAAEKEIIEASITLCFISNKPLPAPEKYNFDSVSYLHGLCESLGELRRYLLDSLRKEKIINSEKYLEIMDEVYYFLIAFHYPDAITRSLRRQVDYVRGILEKTRSDVTSAVIHRK